ncbi:PucR family transcriptional regulator [Lutispora saccharofermentans]|uniref:PucR family transcriptional regulator n=1 Tax=Lutispora saccharofermentans TaxID=3024236 RepID=A0ABT1NJ21_9FIRM|nr:PucR family transcriptional regulator [Lutispora saccharofermentans]MCQ1531280.1 PucR family transcriptional regulator [Lutispora saccharofermentans]
MQDVRSILGLSIFENATIIAGKNGLSRKINRVSFTDCPIRTDGMGERVILPGDFFIGSLYIFKDNLDELSNNIKFYIRYGAVGICVIDEYFTILPKDIIKYADANDFVIFIVDRETPYADIINQITKLIMVDQYDQIMEMKIDSLIHDKLNNLEAINVSKSILEYNFKKYYVLYSSDTFKSNNKREIFRTMINKNSKKLFIRYKLGFFLIVETSDDKKYEQLNDIIDNIKGYHNEVHIGISGIFNEIESLKDAFRQSITSWDFSNSTNTHIVYYNKLSLYKILYLIKDTVEYKSIFSELIGPIIEYDEKYNTNILDTLITYVECDGDYRKTSKALFQHENTVRYRIQKAKSILSLEERNLEFLECICLIEKMYKLSSDK